MFPARFVLGHHPRAEFLAIDPDMLLVVTGIGSSESQPGAQCAIRQLEFFSQFPARVEHWQQTGRTDDNGMRKFDVVFRGSYGGYGNSVGLGVYSGPNNIDVRLCCRMG